MEGRKYQVFLSSTYSDLIEERRKVLDILLMADCIPAGMEAFVATDNEQFEVIKRVIDLCDYYILIIGKRYGTINEVTELSYTEMEYDYAKEKNIPVLAFVIDDSVLLPNEKNDTDPIKIEKLKKFRQKAMTNRLISIWKTCDELIGKLSVAIMRAKSEIIRPGWQRATDYDEATLLRNIIDLKVQKGELETKLQNANNMILSLTKQNNVAFDNADIQIDYYYYENNIRRDYGKHYKLPELFKVIATEMMDVSITEEAISNAIKNYMFSSTYGKYFRDNQLIKRLVNQYKALGLLNSFWNKDKSVLFWGLTPKGQKTRDEMILLKNKDTI